MLYASTLNLSFNIPVNIHQKEFTQIGDHGYVIYPTTQGPLFPNMDYQWASDVSKINFVSGIITHCSTNIAG